MGWIAAVGERGDVVTPPGAPFDYGPTNGPDLVRTGAVPQAVIHPGGSPTVVNPGDSIATKITTAGTGGTLWFTKGIHVVTSRLFPLANQKWVLESAAGINRTAADSAVFDGQDANFESMIMNPIGNVEIRGGVFMRQGNSAGDATTWHATILHDGLPGAGGWLVTDAVIKDNRNTGLKFQGPNCVARRCYVYNNGRYGVNLGTTSTLEYTQIANNNSRNLDIGDDAGGTKLAAGLSPSTTVQYCWVHDNNGSGIWVDGAAGGHLIQENVCERNINWGCFYELSQGNATITRNYFNDNGEAGEGNWFNAVQLLVSCSDGTLTPGDIVISLNDIDATERAMGLINHPNHPTDSRRVKFRNNRVWLRNTIGFGGEGGQVGGQDTQTTKTLWTDTTNEFSGNEYRVASSTFTYWKWGGTTGNLLTWEQWLALGLNRGNAVDTRVLI